MIIFTVPPEVEEVRNRILEIQAELAEIRTAPLCDVEAEEKCRAVVSSHAARAGTNRILAHLIHAEASSRIGWPTDASGSSIEPSAFDLLCAFEPKRMQDALKKLVTTSTHLRGPATSERLRRNEELNAALLEAEIEEESLIEAAEARGINVHRRRDANPAIILGVHQCT